ncbi:MFS transporter [Actinomadura harenae]|uniref:MFS transporter n=1 Tax=Actinomadura harenae TaxID=2483351 RepID=A0A3M2M9C2_9ACTN|nr:MFS transporter [Actinomadura harenae]RMI45483.1 MFS transporter [Actinomadura harenae]
MSGTLAQARSFSRPVQVLLVNQVGINIGFYMLMPFLAAYLTGPAGLSAAMAGLVLGIRNFSQQGMFLIGGTVADRLGYRPAIIAGCGLRVLGFAAFAASTTPAVLIGAAVLTGLAGALFNPAARAYVAVEAADRRTEAFAVFNVFYQLGILIGPLAGLALLGSGFRAVCMAAALIFAVLTGLQLAFLPARRPTGPDTLTEGRRPVLTDWRRAAGDRAFTAFAVSMLASYALSFQVYLGLPLEIQRLTGHQHAVVVVFAVQAVLALAGQVRLTTWCTARYRPGQVIWRGLAVMAAAFAPMAAAAALPAAGGGGRPAGLVEAAMPLGLILAAAVLLAVGTMLVFPFEMTVLTTLGPPHLLGTYYGVYNLASGIGILTGNLLSGAALDAARTHGMPALPWLALTAVGAVSALAVAALDRHGHLTAPAAEPAHSTVPAR